MKGEMSEVLLTPVGMMGGGRRNNNGDWSILWTMGMTAILVIVALSAIRYETKIGQLETRLEILETESIIKETLGVQIKPSELIGGELKFVKGETEQPRQKREANVAAGRSSSHLSRNDQDETYFTHGRHYVRPSGLAEMNERLGPEEGTGYRSPPIDYSQQAAPSTSAPSRIQTRASSGRAYVPAVQRVGTGADQVSARVVRYRSGDSASGALYDPLTDTDSTPTNTWTRPQTTSSFTSTSSTSGSSSSVVAGHFVADVSNFTSSDNPRLRNANGIFQIWRPASWMGNQQNFVLDSKDGGVTVQRSGIFHIYAQIHYHDEQQNSFIVEVNGSPLLQCTTTQNGLNSCFTAGLHELKRGDRIVIKNVGVDRFSIYRAEKSFFGLVKVGN